MQYRYADVLAEYHDEDHLVKFEELLEAAVDLDRIPDEYLICASYDAGLQVCTPMQHQHRCFKHALIGRMHSLIGSTHEFILPHQQLLQACSDWIYAEEYTH